MAVHKIKKGLDLPMVGAPIQNISETKTTTQVALVASDYVGMKPRMLVQVGDTVKRGQPLFEDRKQPGVIHTSPGAGVVSAINRGERRAFESLVIDLSKTEQLGEPTADELQSFSTFTGSELGADELRALLIESGMWTALRTRPYSRQPAVDSTPKALFVNAMNTEPHAASVDVAMSGHEAMFEKGLAALAKLAPKTYLCRGTDSAAKGTDGVIVEEFSGPHPAGLVGTHIHTLEGASRSHTVWHINYADVIAIGALLTTGTLSDVTRVVSLAGPTVNKPRLVNTRIGANLTQMSSGELAAGENRVISGSVLSGTAAMGSRFEFLGRYALQVSALNEGRERKFLGWLNPGFNMFSTMPAFLSALTPNKKFAFTTTTNGSHRAMVPVGMFEKVMPLDIMPTFLLRSLLVQDLEKSEELGALELDDEDLALCSFVAPGKHDFGAVLRKNLDTICKEG